jgi:hypothetical protein
VRGPLAEERVAATSRAATEIGAFIGLNADHCPSLSCAFGQDRQGFVVLRQCGGSSILGYNNEGISPPSEAQVSLNW